MDDYTRLRTPFANMSFTPDVPSNALGANEYNSGQNVEADVRGIKKVAGEQAILSAIPGNVFYIDGGFRDQATWVYLAATIEGHWYMITASGTVNITPGKFGTASAEDIYLNDGKGERVLLANTSQSFSLYSTLSSNDNSVSPIISDAGLTAYTITWNINNCPLSNSLFSFDL